EGADHHGNAVLPALGIDHVLEQERLAILLRDAAAELPAHQRMHLGVLVDRAIDGHQQARLVERPEVVVKIRVLHSTEMFLSRTIFPHLAWSERMRCASASGVLAMRSQPCASKRSFIEGSPSRRASVPCNRSSTGFGVPAGANIATQDSVSNPG